MDPIGRLDRSRRHVAILVNPRAGWRARGRPVHDLTDGLYRRGLEPHICRDFSTLDHVLGEYDGELRCLVAAGGDGTLSAALNRAPDVPVALLPLGNENLAAKYFDLPCDGRRLARAIASGHFCRADLAQANAQRFALMAGAGFDADVVHRVHQQRRGHITQLTYALPTHAALWSYRFPPITVDIVDSGEQLRGAMAFVFNLPQYGLNLPIAPEARPDDGLLDLIVFQKPGVRNLLRYLGAILFHRRLPDFIHRRVRCVKLSAAEPVPLQIDGDPAGFLPATIEVVPNALTLLLPRRRSAPRLTSALAARS
jgi:diacylglycerol kinase family enzyme